MRRLALVAAMAFASLAVAQTPGSFAPHTPLAAAQLNASAAGKVDYSPTSVGTVNGTDQIPDKPAGSSATLSTQASGFLAYIQASLGLGSFANQFYATPPPIGGSTPAPGTFTTLTGTISVLATGAGGIGYTTGAGSTVTQITSRTTGVTINKTTGQITLFTAAGSATPATLRVTDSTVAASDTIGLSVHAATNKYLLDVTAVADGSFDITFATTGGTASDAPVINFTVVKGAVASVPTTGGTLLAKQFPGYPQSNSFFPLGANFILAARSGALDNITAICGLPTTFRGACNGTLSGYPPIASTSIPAPCAGGPTTIAFPTGSNISAAANMGANTIEIIGGSGPAGGNKWPEGVNCDYGEMIAAQIENLNVMAGGPPAQGHAATNSLNDTSFDSVSSQIAVAMAAYHQATGLTGAPNLIGHFAYDEPTCTPANKVSVDSIASNLNVAFWDSADSVANGIGARPTYSNQFGSWMAYLPNSGGPTKLASNGNIFPCAGPTCPTLADGSTLPNYTGASCIYSAGSTGNFVFGPDPIFVRALQTSAIAIFDDYTQIGIGGGASTVAIYAAPGDGVYPNDRIWLQAFILTNMSKLMCPANGAGLGAPGGPLVTNGGVDNCLTQKPQTMMTFLEAANDALGGGSGSSTLFNASYDPGADAHTLNYNTASCTNVTICGYFGATSAPGCSPVPSASCSGWIGLGITDATAYVEVVDPTGSGAHVTANITPGPAGCPVVTIAGVPTQTLNCILSYTVNAPGSGYTAPYIQVVSAASGAFATASVALSGSGIASVTASNCGAGLSGCGRNYTGGANCIPFGTTITAIPGGPHSQTATISNALTCPAVKTGVRVVDNPDRVAFAGHGMTSCRYTVANVIDNSCPLTGQRYRTTAQDITSEATSSIIAGSRGLFWFQQDGCSNGWGYGGNSGGACLTGVDYSSQAAANISLKAVQYVNLLITKYAADINAAVVGQCSTEYGILAGPGTGNDVFITDPATHTFPYCQNGLLTFQSSSKSFPGEALITNPPADVTTYYLFVSPLRCSQANCFCPQHAGDVCQPAGSWDNRAATDLTGAGHTFTITLAGLAGKTATIVYDSGCDFGASVCTEGASHILDGSGAFSEVFGDAGDGSNYQIRIYKIQ